VSLRGGGTAFKAPTGGGKRPGRGNRRVIPGDSIGHFRKVTGTLLAGLRLRDPQAIS